MKYIALSLVILLVSGCAAQKIVRQQDLDSWVGVPVEALDTHSEFLTLRMVRTHTDSGIEIRNYVNESDTATCTGSGSANKFGSWVNASTFTTCSSDKIACNNIFYIKDGKVLEYAPTGQCYTDNSVRPQARYKTMTMK